MSKLLKSPWLELITMCAVVILSYITLVLISRGAETPPGGMSLNNISLLTFGFFLLSFAIAMIAVMAGIGGGVLFTPLMLAFTPVDSLIIRGTGLIVAIELAEDSTTIVGFVEFFGVMTYKVTLGRFGQLAIPISAGHYFDVKYKQILQMDAIRPSHGLWIPR